MPKTRVVPQGLYSGLNDILLPPGACSVAQNVVFAADGTVVPRWGWEEYGSGTKTTTTTIPNDLQAFDGVLYWTRPSAARFYDASDHSFISIASNENANYYAGSGMYVARGRLYSLSDPTTSGGNAFSIGSQSDSSARPSGISPPPPPDRWTGLGGSGADWDIPANMTYGIRACIKRTYPNGLVTRSAPSSPAFAQSKNHGQRPEWRTFLPIEAIAGDVLELYRTSLVAQDPDPGLTSWGSETRVAVPEEYFLTASVVLSSANITAGYVDTFIYGDRRLGAALYTNPSVEGIERSNFRAPAASCAAVYKGTVFHGGLYDSHVVTMDFTAVAGLVYDFWDAPPATTFMNGGASSLAFRYSDGTAGTNNVNCWDFDGDGVPEGIGVWQMDLVTTTNGSADVTVTNGTPIRVGQLVTARGGTGSPTGWTASTPLYVTAKAGNVITLSANNSGGVAVDMDFHDGITIMGIEIFAHTNEVTSGTSTNGRAYFNVVDVYQTIDWWQLDLEVSKSVVCYRTAQSYARVWTWESNGNYLYSPIGGFAITPGNPVVPESAGKVSFYTSVYHLPSATTSYTIKVNDFNAPGSTTTPYTEDYVLFPELSQENDPRTKDTVSSSRRDIAWSKQDQPEHFPPLYRTTLASNVTAMSGTEDVLYIFTEREIYGLSGDGPESGWTLEQITPADDSGIYLLDRRAVYSYGDTVYALTNLGLVTLRGGQIAKIDQKIPQEIRRFVQSSTRSSYTVCLGYEPTYETLLVTLSLGTTSTTVYAYSTTTGNWSTLTVPYDRSTNDQDPWVPYAYTILDSRLYYLGKTNAAVGGSTTTNSIAVFAERQWVTSTTQESILHHLDLSTSDATVTVTGSSSPYTLSGVLNGLQTQAGDVLIAPNGTYCFVTYVNLNGDATVLASTTPDAGTYTRYDGYSCRLKFYPWFLEEHGEYKLFRMLALAFNQRLGISGSQRRTYTKVDYEAHNAATASGSFTDLSSLPVATFYVPSSVARTLALGPDITWYPWSVSGLSGIEVSYVVTTKGKAGWRRS